MKLNVNDMPVFAVVARERGITAAARKLGQPKSSVSTAISRLEAALRVRLLERNTRRVRLTSEGEGFLKHCLMVEEQLQAAEAEMSGYLSEPRGACVCPLTMALQPGGGGRRPDRVPAALPRCGAGRARVQRLQRGCHWRSGRRGDQGGPARRLQPGASKLVDTPLIWVASPGLPHAMPDRDIPGGLARHLQVLDERYTHLQLSMEHRGSGCRSARAPSICRMTR